MDLIYFGNLGAQRPVSGGGSALALHDGQSRGGSGRDPCQSLVLLEHPPGPGEGSNHVFHPRSPAPEPPSAPGTRLDVVRMPSLSESRCLSFQRQKTSFTLELVFLQNLRRQSDSGRQAPALRKPGRFSRAPAPWICRTAGMVPEV